ncbi:dehydrogenase/reductase SDR family protein 7-like [Liolophura sinensis]|uniref:dehydrogenase/reductase SDR family protein 7-like n=1 Tax=Liolophura sinensis TaxID=3198878 RepID=UPI0031586D13
MALVWKIAGSFLLPITIVYLLIRFCGRKKLCLRNKVVLITGASSGLGEACAHAFYRAGCKLILAGRRGKELQRVKDDLLTKTDVKNDKVHPPELAVLDITDASSLQEKMASIVALYGVLDILINNAGISYRGEIEHTNMDVYRKLMEVNFFGQIALTKEILPVMVQQKKGMIVFISSMQGKVSIPYRSAYSSAKHALQAFSDCLRAETAERGVDVCVVSPGYISTNLSRNAVRGDGSLHGVIDKTTASGMTPQEAAQAVLQTVTYRHQDVVLSSITHKLAIYIRTLLPSLFFWIMLKRAKKYRDENK